MDRRTVGILVFDGVEVLDFAGPFEVFSRTRLVAGADLLASLDPTITVERGVRFVEDGIISSAGVAAGIDMSFHLVAELCGQAVAEETARYIEYPWPRTGADATGPRALA